MRWTAAPVVLALSRAAMATSAMPDATHRRAPVVVDSGIDADPNMPPHARRDRAVRRRRRARRSAPTSTRTRRSSSCGPTARRSGAGSSCRRARRSTRPTWTTGSSRSARSSGRSSRATTSASRRASSSASATPARPATTGSTSRTSGTPTQDDDDRGSRSASTDANGTQHDIPRALPVPRRATRTLKPARMLGFAAIQLDCDTAPPATSTLADLVAEGKLTRTRRRGSGAVLPAARRPTQRAGRARLPARELRPLPQPELAASTRTQTPMELRLTVGTLGALSTTPAYQTAVDHDATLADRRPTPAHRQAGRCPTTRS